MKQIVRYGYFAEQFPTCFHSHKLVKNLDEILLLVSTESISSKKHTTLPATVSAYKNDISRRVLALPNPESFLRVCKLMQENWDEIQKFAKSKNSLSPITYIHTYNFGHKIIINSDNAREAMKGKSGFVDGVKNRIRASLGYQYRLKVDISKCYYSIYTHSIAWAICGKKDAKNTFLLNNHRPCDSNMNSQISWMHLCDFRKTMKPTVY